MKKTALWKDIYREITKSKMRFLSIFLIILLGVAFYSGIKATGPAMLNTADDYYTDRQLMDVKVQSSYGLKEEDIALLEEVEGTTVEPRYTQDVLFEQTELVTRVVSIPAGNKPQINQPVVMDGRLPEKAGEIVLDSKSAYAGEYAIGDTVTFKSDDDDVHLEDSFSQLTYEIVGFVSSPQYIENSARGNTTVGMGTLDGYAYIPSEDFNMDVYTEAYMTFSNTEDLVSYSNEYESQIKENQKDVESVLTGRPEERRQEIQDRIQIEIDKGQAKIDEGRAEIEDGKQALADAETQLANARAEIDQGWEDYHNGIATLETEIANGQAMIDQKRQELENAHYAIVNGRAELDIAEEELNQSRERLEQERVSGETQIANGTAAVNNALGTVSLPKDTLSSEVQESLLAGAKTLGPESEQLVQGYLDGTVPAQTTIAGLETAATSIPGDVPEETVTAIQEWVASVRSIIQIPGVNVSLEQQVAVIEQMRSIETGLGDLMSNYYDGVVPPNTVTAELEATESRLLGIRSHLDNYEAELNAAQTEIDQQRAVLASSEQEVAAGRTDLDEAQTELERQRANGQTELENAQAELEQAEVDYEAAVAEFQSERETAETEIANAEVEIRKGESDLEEARTELGDLTLPEYFVLDRTSNPGYAAFSDNADRIAAIAQIFPIFFFLIAALVSLTTMTRMVDEQRTHIGTLKALGYSNWDISNKFLVYASAASLAGSILGLFIGFNLFPNVIFEAYGSLYNMPSVIVTYYPSYILISLLIAFLCTGLAALIAVRVSLKSNAATLMRPKAPKSGKRILLERMPFIWNRFSFTQKITARNLFRYKRRMLMTVAGIAGCTALMLTGFGLSDSISDVGTLQFGKVNQYDSMVTLNREASDFEKEEYNQFVENTSELENNLKVYQEIYQAEAENVNTQEIALFVPEATEDLSEFVSLHNRVSEESYSLTDDGAVVSEKLAELFDLQPGDSFTITDADNQEVKVKVSHITENYVGHSVYLSPAYYETVIGELPEMNTHLLNFDETQRWEEEFGQQLTHLDSVLGVNFTSKISEAFESTLGSLVIVTIVLIVSAALLAFVVLYNLTNINVSERIRELSTIKVLGFYNKEVTMYVYRENFVLTLMGIVVGSLFGLVMHGFVLSTAEMDNLMFSQTIDPSSYVYSALLTMLFSIIVMLFMHIKLKNIDMLEALKTLD